MFPDVSRFMFCNCHHLVVSRQSLGWHRFYSDYVYPVVCVVRPVRLAPIWVRALCTLIFCCNRCVRARQVPSRSRPRWEGDAYWDRGSPHVHASTGSLSARTAHGQGRQWVKDITNSSEVAHRALGARFCGRRQALDVSGSCHLLSFCLSCCGGACVVGY